MEKNNQEKPHNETFVGQTVGYGIGIAAEFVRQLSKLNSK